MKYLLSLIIVIGLVFSSNAQDSKLRPPKNISSDMISSNSLESLKSSSGITLEDGYMWMHEKSAKSLFVISLGEDGSFLWANFDTDVSDFTDAAIGTWTMKKEKIKVEPSEDNPSRWADDTLVVSDDKKSFKTSSGETYYKFEVE